MSAPTPLSRYPTLARSLVLERTWPFFLDLSVAACGLALFYAVLRIAQYWMGHPVASVAISQFREDAAAVCLLLGGAHRRRLPAEPDLCRRVRLHRRVHSAGRSLHDRGPGYSAIDSRPQLSACGDAGHDLAHSRAPAGHRDGRHPADLYRAGMEHGVQLLLIAQEPAARAARSRQRLSLFRVAALLAAGTAVLGHWAGVELDGLGGRRMVFPDGLRDVRAWAIATSVCPDSALTCRRRPAQATTMACCGDQSP